MPERPGFFLGGELVQPGTQRVVDVPISHLSNRLPMTLPVRVVHGRPPGPVVFVSGAVHGDEIIGVEIIRRLARRPLLRRLSGTLLLVPVVNGYGFLAHSRYLPDRRDLNRSFPGSDGGSLAARLSRAFSTEVIQRSNYGIDLHSAAIHRENLPQIRYSEGDPETRRLAEVFGAPAIIRSTVREGSLRETAARAGVRVLVFEGGEGLRFDETTVRSGVAGVLRLLAHLQMLPEHIVPKPRSKPAASVRSTWLRAPEAGILRLFRGLGAHVAVGQRVGAVSDLFGDRQVDVIANEPGIIIGRTTLPIVNEGDAILHVATVKEPTAAAQQVETLVEQLEQVELFDEDEII